MASFKDIAGYEGRYQISDDGRVLSVKFKQGRAGRLLVPSLDSWGYPSVTLYDGTGRKGRKSVNVHSLVADAFLGKRPDGMAINHKDGNKSNGTASNLEYVSHTGNARHAVKNGLWPWASLSEEKAQKIRALAKEGSKATEIAKQFAVSPTTIGRILNGKLWQSSQKAG